MTEKTTKPDLEAEPVVDPSPPVHGRALVDIHRLGLSCGQYGTVPAEEVAALVAAGEFDPAAVPAEEVAALVAAGEFDPAAGA